MELADLSHTSTNADYCIGRIEGVMDGIDELIGGYNHSHHIQGLLSLRGRLSHMLLVWRGNMVQPCSIAAAGGGSVIEVQDSFARGHPKIYVNVDQVELLRSAGTKWQTVSL